MANVFLSLALVAAVGVVVRALLRETVNPETLRQTINTVVLNVLLPALIFQVIVKADLGSESYKVPLAMAAGVVVCLALGAFVYGFFRIDGRIKGALILACAFGNVTYLGLPVLQEMFGVEASKVAFFSEVTVSSLNLVAGAAIASWFASGGGGSYSFLKSLYAVFKLPPVWALAVAVAFNRYEVAVPEWVLDSARLLGVGVSGLMILSLGMTLRFPRPESVGLLIPVALVKLALSPLVVYIAARALGMKGVLHEAVVVEGAMPSQLLTFVIADRFKLDVNVLALAIGLDTALAFVTIPFVHGRLF